MIDPRIFPLIETLDGVGLDWLSRDVIASIFDGRPLIETEETLAAVRLGSDDGASGFLDLESVAASPSTPLSGDEQVEMAAALVSERLRGALTMMLESIQRLDQIADGPDSVAASKHAGAILRFDSDVDGDGADATRVSAAIAAVEEL